MLANAAIFYWLELNFGLVDCFLCIFPTGSSDERPEEMDTGALPGQNDDTLSQVQECWAFFMN